MDGKMDLPSSESLFHSPTSINNVFFNEPLAPGRLAVSAQELLAMPGAHTIATSLLYLFQRNMCTLPQNKYGNTVSNAEPKYSVSGLTDSLPNTRPDSSFSSNGLPFSSSIRACERKSKTESTPPVELLLDKPLRQFKRRPKYVPYTSYKPTPPVDLLLDKPLPQFKRRPKYVPYTSYKPTPPVDLLFDKPSPQFKRRPNAVPYTSYKPTPPAELLLDKPLPQFSSLPKSISYTSYKPIPPFYKPVSDSQLRPESASCSCFKSAVPFGLLPDQRLPRYDLSSESNLIKRVKAKVQKRPGSKCKFTDICPPRKTRRISAVVTFMNLLSLAKTGQISVSQDQLNGECYGLYPDIFVTAPPKPLAKPEADLALSSCSSSTSSFLNPVSPYPWMSQYELFSNSKESGFEKIDYQPAFTMSDVTTTDSDSNEDANHQRNLLSLPCISDVAEAVLKCPGSRCMFTDICPPSRINKLTAASMFDRIISLAKSGSITILQNKIDEILLVASDDYYITNLSESLK